MFPPAVNASHFEFFNTGCIIIAHTTYYCYYYNCYLSARKSHCKCTVELCNVFGGRRAGLGLQTMRRRSGKSFLGEQNNFSPYIHSYVYNIIYRVYHGYLTFLHDTQTLCRTNVFYLRSVRVCGEGLKDLLSVGSRRNPKGIWILM